MVITIIEWFYFVFIFTCIIFVEVLFNHSKHEPQRRFLSGLYQHLESTV